MIKILHTSDWHLGRVLYGRKRYEEFEKFLEFLAITIEQQEVDVLLVAGDIFDNTTPSNRSQSLYYEFLCRVAASCCRHVVVIAGNHDSPTFLNAPRALLRALDVHVIGCAHNDPAKDVISLKDANGQLELIVCAIPYLRDRDLRKVDAAESMEDKNNKLIEGIRTHYARAAAVCEDIRAKQSIHVPVIAMGHLFAAGGQTTDGDGVRELYVGSLAHIRANIFAEIFDYVALGHLHVPQKVGGESRVRYSGSPLAMGFGEAKQQKSLCLVKFDGNTHEQALINVPPFQALARIQGSWDQISSEIHNQINEKRSVWLEVIYEGNELISDLRGQLEALIEGSQIEILRIRNNRLVERVLNQSAQGETLDSLDVNDVFQRCLDTHEIPVEQQPTLHQAYSEILTDMHDADQLAE